MHALSSTLALCVSLLLGVAKPQWSPHPGPPHPGILLAMMSAGEPKLVFEDFVGDVHLQEETGDLILVWGRVGATRSPTYKLQRIPLGYYPTCACATLDGKGLYIGGKRRSNGNTTIARMDFTSPQFLDLDGSPDVIVDASVSDIDFLYDDAVQGRDYVINIAPAMSGGGEVLAQFYDSRDVYQVAPSTGSGASLSLLASIGASAGAPMVIPEIEGLHSGFQSADHIVRGYVYILRPQEALLKPSSSVVVFEDTDRNGVVDGFEVFDLVTWKASDMGEASNYQ